MTRGWWMDGVFGCESEGEWCQVPSDFVSFLPEMRLSIWLAHGIAEAGESVGARRPASRVRYSILGLSQFSDEGIALGCPLSPVMGAFFPRAVDQELGKLGLFYVRFMDDIVVLAPTRWKLRAAVKALNQALGAPRLAKHPGKTFIGRIEKGFDFLGYHFSPRGLTPARQTMVNFLERAIRLYEQEPGESLISAPGLERTFGGGRVRRV